MAVGRGVRRVLESRDERAGCNELRSGPYFAEHPKAKDRWFYKVAGGFYGNATEVVGAGANVLVFGRFEIAVLSDSRSPVVRGLDYLMSSKSLNWRLPKRRRPSETMDAKKNERRNRGMARSAEFIHFRLGADTS